MKRPLRSSFLSWTLFTLLCLKLFLVLPSPPTPILFLSYLLILPHLFITDSAEEVVRLDLEVLAMLSANDTYFDKLMNNLITLFSADGRVCPPPPSPPKVLHLW